VSSGAAGGEGAAGGAEFTIAEFAFPDDFVATAGEEFTVTNDDEFAHTVTSTEFDVELDGETSKPLTIDTAGTYDIVCTIHPQMTGTITVE
jgi:plastocyanin